MYEVVRTIKGIDIVRMKGCRGCYHVCIWECNAWRELRTFKTMKSAVQFIEKVF